MDFTIAILLLNTFICGIIGILAIKRWSRVFLYVMFSFSVVTYLAALILNIISFNEAASLHGVFISIIAPIPLIYLLFIICMDGHKIDDLDSPIGKIYTTSKIITSMLVFMSAMCIAIVFNINNSFDYDYYYDINSCNITLLNSSEAIRIKEEGIELEECGYANFLVEDNAEPLKVPKNEYKINIVDDIEYPYYILKTYDISSFKYGKEDGEESKIVNVYEIYVRESDIKTVNMK